MATKMATAAEAVAKNIAKYFQCFFSSGNSFEEYKKSVECGEDRKDHENLLEAVFSMEVILLIFWMRRLLNGNEGTIAVRSKIVADIETLKELLTENIQWENDFEVCLALLDYEPLKGSYLERTELGYCDCHSEICSNCYKGCTCGEDGPANTYFPTPYTGGPCVFCCKREQRIQDAAAVLVIQRAFRSYQTFHVSANSSGT